MTSPPRTPSGPADAERTVRYVASDLQAAADQCFRTGHQLPGLILVYSTIDTALIRPAGAPEGRRQDFVDWVDTYLLPGSGLTCSALELYAARCAVVHTYGAGSRLSRAGRARTVAYGSGAPTRVRGTDRDGRPVIPIHIATLWSALATALARFLQDLHASPAKRRLVEQHAEDLYLVEVRPPR
jgi:hypothetical protein